jgi:transposase InsO family protein
VNINDWQPPTTGKQVQSYMGTFNFFRDHVPLIATISAPLDAMRNVAGPFTLNAAQLKSFEALKNLLVLSPIIAWVDFNLPLYVATDASNVGIGAVLYQLPEGEANPNNIRYISFVARSLQPSERRYSTTQRELLAIVFALKKLHYYLWGRHFTLFTDHRALTFMHTQKEMNSMLTAWQETILDYTFKVVYRPGVLNVLPDALSRQFPQELWTSRIPGTAPSKIYGYVHLIQDADTQRVTVTISKRQAVIEDAHALGHIGANAMVKHIHSLQKTWPHLAKDCLEYVQRCQECQRVNIARKGYHPLSAIHAQLPGEHMAVDLTGPFPVESNGNRFLLILVDVCTRFVFLEPIPDKKAMTIAKVLFKIFTTIGFPRILQSDNGREFVNEAVQVMTTTMGVQHRLLTPYHPRGNGVAENHVKTACNIIRKEVKDHKQQWANHVPMAQLAMNTRIVALHNSSPFSLFFARRYNGISNFSDTTEKLSSQEELLERLEYMTKTVFPAIDTKTRETQRRMIERFNRTVLHSEFPDGAKVMSLDPILGDKLSPRYEGPYTVVRRTTGGSYVLKDATGEELGRNFAPSQLKLVLDDFEATDTYVVEKILNHRQGPGGGMEYRVKWKGYKEETWEPQENFIERKCITDYWKIQDQPGSHSLTQPRQTATTLGARGQEQELSPSQRSGAKEASKNVSNGDARNKGARKRADLDEEDDQLIDRRRSKRLRGADANGEKMRVELRTSRRRMPDRH